MPRKRRQPLSSPLVNRGAAPRSMQSLSSVPVGRGAGRGSRLPALKGRAVFCTGAASNSHWDLLSPLQSEVVIAIHKASQSHLQRRPFLMYPPSFGVSNLVADDFSQKTLYSKGRRRIPVHVSGRLELKGLGFSWEKPPANPRAFGPNP